MAIDITIPTLNSKFQDYRQDIPGDSFTWGPVIKATDIDTFTFHHTVTKQTAKTDGNWKKECDAVGNLHLSRGWAGVGYRFIICSDGTVAYVGDLSRGGSAVADHNNHMFSASFVGDFTKELPTAAQVHSAHLLAKHFLFEMPQYPNLKDWTQIKGHKDFNPTACPGSNWTGPDNLRDRILNDRFVGYPDPQPVGTVTPPVPTPPAPIIDWEQKAKELEEQVNQQKTIIDNLNQQINDRNNDITQLNSKLTTAEGQIVDLTTQRDSAIAQAQDYLQIKRERDELLNQRDLWTTQERNYKKEITKLTSTNNDLRSGSVGKLAKAIFKTIFPFL